MRSLELTTNDLPLRESTIDLIAAPPVEADMRRVCHVPFARVCGRGVGKEATALRSVSTRASVVRELTW